MRKTTLFAVAALALTGIGTWFGVRIFYRHRCIGWPSR